MSQRGGAVDAAFHHRSTFKRSNKPFKGRSKGKQERSNRGKVDKPSSTAAASAPPPSLSSSSVSSKQARVNRSRQLQQQKRQELVTQKRIGSSRGPPRIVALIPLNAAIDTAAAARRIASDCDSSLPLWGGSLQEVCWLHGGRERRLLLYSTPRTQNAVLDIAKVADVVCFLLSPSPPSASSSSHAAADTASSLSEDADSSIDVDDFGRHAITILKAQGLPAVIGVTTASGTAETAAPLTAKRQAQFRRTALRYFHTAFGADTKVVAVEEQRAGMELEEAEVKDTGREAGGAAMLLRWLSELKLREIGWRERRCYLLAQSAAYNPQTRVLKVCGHLRGGRGLDVNGLVHVTGHGDYQIDRVEAAGRKDRKGRGDGGRRSRRSSVAEEKKEAEDAAMRAEEEESKEGAAVPVLAASTAEKRESLLSLNPIDPLAHDQSIITEEEMAAAAAAADDDMADDDQRQERDDDNDGDEEEGSSLPSAQLAAAKEKRRHVPGETDHQAAWEAALGWQGEDDSPFPAASLASEGDAASELQVKRKLERDDVDFPDEVDYPMDTVCKQRFARYRGLKSFQHSDWDVKESLPVEYSQIFSFADFKHSRAVAARQDSQADGIVQAEGGEEVLLSLLDVDAEAAAAMTAGGQEGAARGPLVLFCLWQHEHKVSVSHCSMLRQAEWQQPVKAKERMEFHCAFRRFVASPIYSSHPPQQPRALVDRFFHPERFTTVSFYSRILFPPAPVLMFLPPSASSSPSSSSAINPIVASGSLSSIDPDRLQLKRIVLTGSPVSCHGRQAIVRHMFFNPADVDWFKPVELRSKRGLVGHIRQSHGLKGGMDCSFDGRLQQSDVVCMMLYKRQFCKLDTAAFPEH